jgi:branched-subunit amino acid aminotransferase/4-amino-4-deoxychorismate lyase
VARSDSFEISAGQALKLGQDPSLNAASARLPDGAYTTLRTFGRVRVLRLASHLARLNQSAASLGCRGTLEEDELRQGLAAALAATGHDESRLRVTYVPPRLFVSIERFVPRPSTLYREGASCVTVTLRRREPRPKDTRFIARVAEARRHLPPGAEEGLMLDESGALLEGLSSNFFAVRGGTLHTERDRVLQGITRALVLETALGFVPVELRPVHLSEIAQVQGCFLTSASRGVLPVTRIDGHRIGTGRPEAVTRALAERLAALAEREAVAVL